jgi:hypothetical protein
MNSEPRSGTFIYGTAVHTFQRNFTQRRMLSTARTNHGAESQHAAFRQPQRRRSSVIHEQAWQKLMNDLHKLESTEICNDSSRSTCEKGQFANVRKRVSWHDQSNAKICHHTKWPVPVKSDLRAQVLIKSTVPSIPTSRSDGPKEFQTAQKTAQLESYANANTGRKARSPTSFTAEAQQRQVSCTSGIARAMAGVLRNTIPRIK